MSSTFAVLEVSPAAYAEISQALKRGGYNVERAGEINMEGIHLVAREQRPNMVAFGAPKLAVVSKDKQE